MNQSSYIGNLFLGVGILDELVTFLAKHFTLEKVTMYAISLFSTIAERLLLLAVFSAVMVLILFSAHLVQSRRLRYSIPIIGIFLCISLLYRLVPSTDATLLALFCSGVMAVILAPRLRRQSDPAQKPPNFGLLAWLTATVLLPLFAVGCLNGWALQHLAKRFHRDAAVHEFGKVAELYTLAEGSDRRQLYASGQGTDHLLAYDVRNLDGVPLQSSVPTGDAQSFLYNRMWQELYVYNADERILYYLDPGSLKPKRMIRNLELTGGDAKLTYNPATDYLVLASEGNFWPLRGDLGGHPIIVLDRATGRVLYTVDQCDGPCTPGGVYSHPSRPVVYFRFPKRLIAYNLEKRHIVGSWTMMRDWLSAMATTPDGKELLIAEPIQSKVIRLDRKTFQVKGTIDTVFGVRTLAVDEKRNLLLTASLVTNMLEVIDLRTDKRMARYYLGPWLRSICVDDKSGVAYVSSIDLPFKVNYLARVNLRSQNEHAALAGNAKGLAQSPGAFFRNPLVAQPFYNAFLDASPK